MTSTSTSQDRRRAAVLHQLKDAFAASAERDPKQWARDILAEAEAAVRAGQVRPESTGPDKFGVYHFARAAQRDQK